MTHQERRQLARAKRAEILNGPHVLINGAPYRSLADAGVRAGFGTLYGRFVREEVCDYPRGPGMRTVVITVRDSAGHEIRPK